MTSIHTRRTHIASLITTLALGSAGQTPAADRRFDGTWTGILEAPGLHLTLQMVIAGDAVTIISVDQGGARIPANEVAITGEHIS